MDAETLAFLAELERNEPDVSTNETLVPSGERECPICKEKMQVEFHWGIPVDVCEAHGLWLDRGELPGIAAQIRSGARIDRNQAVRQAKRDGKVSGMMFGAWSLLLD